MFEFSSSTVYLTGSDTDTFSNRMWTLIMCTVGDVEISVASTVADPGFPRGGGAKPRGGANIRFCQISPKTAWNWKNLDRGRPLHPP